MAPKLHRNDGMRIVRILTVVCSLLALSAWSLSAGDNAVFFMELPHEALPYAVGANAFAIAGTYNSGGGFYWQPTIGDKTVGGLGAFAISRDGTMIAGNTLDPQNNVNAAIWLGGRNWRVLGGLRPGARDCNRSLSSTYGMSGDGRVIVGLGWDSCAYGHAFRWEQATGMVDLGSLNDYSTRANGVSTDGLVVVGWQDTPDVPHRAAKWVNLREEFIDGPGGPMGEALATNRDGSIIVGQECDFSDGPVTSAWMWKANAGVTCFPLQRPSFAPIRSYVAKMSAVSDDGRVVGGALAFGSEAEASLWIDGTQYYLRDYLQSHGYPNAFQDWVNTGSITGISADGHTIVGFGAGPRTFQGYFVLLPRDAK